MPPTKPEKPQPLMCDYPLPMGESLTVGCALPNDHKGNHSPVRAATEKPQHTRGTWIVSGNAIWSTSCKDRGSVCEFRLATGTHIPDNQNEVNAEFVVAAVNHHQELVEALKRVIRAFEADMEQVPTQDIKTCWETNSQAIGAARAVLAQVEQD